MLPVSNQQRLFGPVILAAVVLIGGCSSSNGGNPAPAVHPTAGDAASGRSAEPDSPVLCSAITLCFPPSVTGPQLLDRVHQNDKWVCAKRGEKDIYGDVVATPIQGICQQDDRKSRPYIQKSDISWDSDTHRPDGRLRSVSITASIQYQQSTGRAANVQTVLTLAPVVFHVATRSLWPDNTSLQQEAEQSLTRLLTKCADLRTKPENRAVLIPTGYKISCSDLAPISIKYPEGTLTTISAIMRIDVPSVREWSPPPGQ